MELEAVEQNPCCMTYFEDLGKIERSWALCYRKDSLTRGSNKMHCGEESQNDKARKGLRPLLFALAFSLLANLN